MLSLLIKTWFSRSKMTKNIFTIFPKSRPDYHRPGLPNTPVYRFPVLPMPIRPVIQSKQTIRSPLNFNPTTFNLWAILPSFCWISGIAPNSVWFAIQISTIIVRQRRMTMDMWYLHIPHLTSFSGSCFWYISFIIWPRCCQGQCLAFASWRSYIGRS